MKKRREKCREVEGGRERWRDDKIAKRSQEKEGREECRDVEGDRKSVV